MAWTNLSMRPTLAARSSGLYPCTWLQVMNCERSSRNGLAALGLETRRSRFPLSGDGSRLFTVGVSGRAVKGGSPSGLAACG